MRKRGARGLTFVELLVTVCLLSMLAMAVAAMIAGGLRLWQRMQARGTGREALQIAAAQLRRDLRSVRRFKPINFEGEHDRVAFPAVVVDAKRDEPELGRLAYFFDWGHRRLCRSAFAYPRARRFSVTDQCATVMEGVRRVRFSYYEFDTETGIGDWTGSWSSQEPPLAVKVEIGYDEQGARQPLTEAITIHLPLAAAEKWGPHT